jgi:Primase C terminal 1 (PriCT-1)/Bifunctional DNA primase/polymerase, N-terminal
MSPLEIRQRLLAAGFDPLPLVGKKCFLREWTKRIATSNGDLEIWSKLYPDATNTGILTRLVPTLDIDILDPTAAEAAEHLVRDRFEDVGRLLVRFGAAPKRAIPFRIADQPFEKIEAKLIVASGPPDQKIQKIEFLGNGQQIVVAGIHPDTGRNYAWFGGELGDVRVAELPPISAIEAKALVDDAAELLSVEHGYRPLEQKIQTDKTAPAPPSQWRDLIKGVAEGARDCSAAKLAGHLFRRRVDPFVVLELLLGWNATHCTPPLPEEDIERIVNSIAGRELRRRGAA